MGTARVTTLLVLLFGLTEPLMAVTCAPSDSSDADPKHLAVEARSFQFFVDEDKHRSVASVGTLKNAGGACFKNILLEAKYFDSQDNLVDTVTRRLGPIFVPPREEVAFRLIGDATRPADSYAKQTLRVIAADADGVAIKTEKSGDEKQPGPKSFGTILIDFFAAFGPLSLFIFVLWYFMYRSGKGSYATRMQQQTELLGKLCVSLDRVAVAVERNEKRTAGN